MSRKLILSLVAGALLAVLLVLMWGTTLTQTTSVPEIPTVLTGEPQELPCWFFAKGC